MSEEDWGDIWTWASAAPHPTDPSKGWAEGTSVPAWSAQDTLVWYKSSSDNGEMIGRFYDSPGGTSRLMRGKCKLEYSPNWNDRTGIFLGNPSFREGNATGGVAQDEINGVLFGFYQNSTSDPKRLYIWRIDQGVVQQLSYVDIPAIFPSLGTDYGSLGEFEAALLVDDTNFLRGGYNNGVYDPNRVTGTSYARPFVRWNTQKTTPTLDAGDWEWSGTNVVLSTSAHNGLSGQWVRRTGFINYYLCVGVNPGVSITIDITGRPGPPGGTGTLDVLAPSVPGLSWSSWQVVTEADDWLSPNLMKNMIEGEYHVGLLTVGTGWASSTNIARFDDVEFNKGTTP